jgi:hypothetical protein
MGENVGTERRPNPPVRVGNAAKDSRGKESGAVRIALLGRFSVSVGERLAEEPVVRPTTAKEEQRQTRMERR